MSKKYIIVTGGVISGIGKGVSAAVTGFFFSEKYSVTTIKLDGYLNIDPGTMNPVEHGEVFVLADGGEVDMDFGHYERFIGNTCTKNQSISMGKVYASIIEKERRGDYLGKTVQMIPHVTDRIISMIEEEFEKSRGDICIIEVGGTVGDIEAELYLEAIRQMKQRKNAQDLVHIHLTYIPIPGGVDEQKTKPTQQSINLLQSKGLFPDMIFARCSEFLTESSRSKIALYSNLQSENILSIPDVSSIYTIPEILYEQNLTSILEKKLGLSIPIPKKYKIWKKTLNNKSHQKIKIGIIGKYTDLEDSYSSVVLALEHAAHYLGVSIEVDMITIREKGYEKKISDCDACIIPGGFGSSGIENLIEATEYLRTHKIPTLGICLGMQVMTIEYFRNVLNNIQAGSLEFDPNIKPNDIVTLLESQKGIKNLGGTMRLGAQETILLPGQVFTLYKKAGRLNDDNTIVERFRHRYEINPQFTHQLKNTDLRIVGTSKGESIAQFIEMDSNVHPYFIGTQAHPELTSKLESPAPLFIGLLSSVQNNT